VLRGIFGLERGEVIEGRRKHHTEERHNPYSSTSITTMIKLRRKTKRAYQHAWKTRKTDTEFWSKNLNRRDRLEDLTTGGRATLTWYLK
jgi:hypothetical protein